MRQPEQSPVSTLSYCTVTGAKVMRYEVDVMEKVAVHRGICNDNIN